MILDLGKYIVSILIFFLISLIFNSNHLTFAQSLTPTPTPDKYQAIKDLENQINELQNKISDLQKQKKTLASQIAVMESQIEITQLKIESTQKEITNLTLDIDTATKKISTLENSLIKFTGVLINRIKATYEIGTIQPFQILLVSNNVSNFFSRLNYLKIVQEHDKKLIYDMTQAKNDYTNQKNIYEDKKKQVEVLKTKLEDYNKQLAQEKKNKDTLLQATQNDEARYQKLLAQAQAEYEAIVRIVAGRGTESEVRNVNQGEIIATIIPTASCNSTGPHLHFTVSKDGVALNPFNFLKPVEYTDNSEGDPFSPTGSWDWPIDPPIKFNQGYGNTWYVRTYGFYPTHNGIDISGSSYNVKAVKSGTLFRGSYSGYQGCTLPYVRVHHKEDDGLDTFYLHTILK